MKFRHYSWLIPVLLTLGVYLDWPKLSSQRIVQDFLTIPVYRVLPATEVEVLYQNQENLPALQEDRQPKSLEQWLEDTNIVIQESDKGQEMVKEWNDAHLVHRYLGGPLRVRFWIDNTHDAKTHDIPMRHLAPSYWDAFKNNSVFGWMNRHINWSMWLILPIASIFFAVFGILYLRCLTLWNDNVSEFVVTWFVKLYLIAFFLWYVLLLFSLWGNTVGWIVSQFK